MQFERGKPPETPNAPYRAARLTDERWRSAGPGFEPGRAGPRLSLTSGKTSSQEDHLTSASESESESAVDLAALIRAQESPRDMTLQSHKLAAPSEEPLSMFSNQREECRREEHMYATYIRSSVSHRLRLARR
jgi:hypothetical protein